MASETLATVLSDDDDDHNDDEKEAKKRKQAHHKVAIAAATAACNYIKLHHVCARVAADADGLLPVANVYPGVRLWCNTEPAAWLLMERDDFAPEVPKPTSSLFGGMLSIV